MTLPVVKAARPLEEVRPRELALRLIVEHHRGGNRYARFADELADRPGETADVIHTLTECVVTMLRELAALTGVKVERLLAPLEAELEKAGAP
jgi:hypothetical protein